MGQADVLRRAVSKKNREILEKERLPFVQAASRRGYEKAVAEEIYDYIVRFADYGFNKAHSVAYAMVAYETAYLKANFPQYYLAALMSTVIGSESSLETYLQEAKQFKVRVVPPDINLSSDQFTVEKDRIRFPLNGVFGITKVKAEQILAERKNGAFVSFEDGVIRLKKILPENLIENLIFSGAFDAFGLTKKTMVEQMPSIISRSEYSFMKDYDLIKPTFSDIEYPFGTLLEKEKRMLGVNLQYNIFDQFNHLYQNRRYTKIAMTKPGKTVEVLGILTRLNLITTKNNEQMAFGIIKDDSGEIDVTIFPSTFKQYQLAVGMLIAIRGRIEERKGKDQLSGINKCKLGGNYESIAMTRWYGHKYGIVEDGNLIEKASVRTDAALGQQALILRLVHTTREMLKKHEVEGVGVSCAGSINIETGTVIAAPEHIKEFLGLNFKQIFKDNFNLECFADNDVNCFAIAEGESGAAKKMSTYLTMTIGTGIGGGIVIRRQIWRGSFYNGAEFGRMFITDKKFEAICSTASLVRAARKPVCRK